MEIKPIKNDADYQAALTEIESLMVAEPDSPEGEKLDVIDLNRNFLNLRF